MKYLFTLLACSLSILGTAQIIELKGEVKFKVPAPAKEIRALSGEIALSLDKQSGTVSFSVPVRSFSFHNNFSSDTLNERLKTRFNDYYMESDRFPLVTFSGNIPGLNLDRDGKYTKQGKGRLTVHGISREIAFNCDIEVRNKQVSVNATAVFVPAYFNIRIPPYVSGFYFRTVTIELRADNKNARDKRIADN